MARNSMDKMTHSGVIIGDAREGGRRVRVLLRETKTFYITRTGDKFRKFDGSCVGKWPAWHLMTESIEPIPKKKG